MCEVDISEAVNRLIGEEDTPKKLRPSAKPLKAQREIMAKLEQLSGEYDLIQVQSDALASQAQALEGMMSELRGELLPVIRDYQDNTIRFGKILAMLKEKPSRKSPVPQWTKFRDWAIAKLAGISKEMGKEAKDFLESTKRMIPGSEEIKVKRVESRVVSEQGVGSVLRRIRNFVRDFWNRISGTSRKLGEIEETMSRFSSPEMGEKRKPSAVRATPHRSDVDLDKELSGVSKRLGRSAAARKGSRTRVSGGVEKGKFRKSSKISRRGKKLDREEESVALLVDEILDATNPGSVK